MEARRSDIFSAHPKSAADSKLLSELKGWRYATLALSLVLALIGLAGMKSANDGRFDVLTVERLDVVDADGTIRAVLSNKERFPAPVIDGKAYPRSVNPAGFVLYDEQGEEVGGLASVSSPRGNTALMALDYSRSEAIGIVKFDGAENGDVGAMLMVQDPTPPGPVERVGTEGTNRVTLGSHNKTSSLVLSDTQGNPRIRLIVDANDQARIEVLDTKGGVEQIYPAQSISEPQPAVK